MYLQRKPSYGLTFSHVFHRIDRESIPCELGVSTRGIKLVETQRARGSSFVGVSFGWPDLEELVLKGRRLTFKILSEATQRRSSRRSKTVHVRCSTEKSAEYLHIRCVSHHKFFMFMHEQFPELTKGRTATNSSSRALQSGQRVLYPANKTHLDLLSEKHTPQSQQNLNRVQEVTDEPAVAQTVSSMLQESSQFSENTQQTLNNHQHADSSKQGVNDSASIDMGDHLNLHSSDRLRLSEVHSAWVEPDIQTIVEIPASNVAITDNPNSTDISNRPEDGLEDVSFACQYNDNSSTNQSENHAHLQEEGEGKLETVIIHKVGESLGFSVAGGGYINEIKPGGPAAEEGSLCKGHRIVMVKEHFCFTCMSIFIIRSYVISWSL